jgi:hypothetical protein
VIVLSAAVSGTSRRVLSRSPVRQAVAVSSSIQNDQSWMDIMTAEFDEPMLVYDSEEDL